MVRELLHCTCIEVSRSGKTDDDRYWSKHVAQSSVETCEISVCKSDKDCYAKFYKNTNTVLCGGVLSGSF
jgi:hypothetical protein